LVFVIGLVYMIAPQLKETASAEVAVAKTKDAEAPAVNSDGKLSDTVMQEIVASGDSVSFVAEDKSEDMDGKDIVVNNGMMKANGTTTITNKAYRNEKTIVSESQKLTQTYVMEEVNKPQVDDYLVVDNESRSYQKQALENEGSFKSADTSKTALNSIGYFSTTTSNMGVMSPSTNATPYYSFTEQDKKKTETKSNDNSNKDFQQSVQTVSRTDNNTNTANGNAGNTADVNTGANTSVSDSTAGFHNAMALNKKGKKKEGEAEKQVSYKQQKSVTQKADEYYAGNEIALNKESEMSGATLDEIELAETNKGEEVEDSKTPKFANAAIPEYPGGVSAMQKFFRDNIKKQGDSKGQVIASFTINKDGSISNAKIISGIAGCDACSAEVLRVIKMMPKWKPASASGKPINITYNLPVRF
jgi:hypothetical protein